MAARPERRTVTIDSSRNRLRWFLFQRQRQAHMLAYVKRTTVKLPDALDARLRHEAERRGVTIADISREALEAYLGGPATRRRLGAAGAGRSGSSDVSERIEELLASEFGR